jgi:hypothetical protein
VIKLPKRKALRIEKEHVKKQNKAKEWHDSFMKVNPGFQIESFDFLRRFHAFGDIWCDKQVPELRREMVFLLQQEKIMPGVNPDFEWKIAVLDHLIYLKSIH